MGGSAEELVYARAEDGVEVEGVYIRPSPGPAAAVAVVWIGGNSMRFYFQSYVRLGRALSGRGYVFVSGNTRGYDIGTWVRTPAGPALGGEAWARFEETPRDLAAWVGLAAADGRRVALVGHSLGAARVVAYQAERQDPRVAGVALASGGANRLVRAPEDDLTARAERLVAAGRGQELLPWGSVPGGAPPLPTLSAQTYLSRVAASAELGGDEGRPAALARIRCPLFACCGARDSFVPDAAGLLDGVRRRATGAARVETRLLEGVDHGYVGHEAAVAEALAAWLAGLA